MRTLFLYLKIMIKTTIKIIYCIRPICFSLRLQHIVIILLFIISINIIAKEIIIEVKGEALAELANRIQVARKDAINKAMREGIGIEISSQTAIQDFELIRDKVVVKANGFIKSVKALDSGRKIDDMFYQMYSITILPSQLKNEFITISLEEQIDIPMLYELIDAPRIAMVIEEIVTNENGVSKKIYPDLHSENIIQGFFKKRNSNFYFVSLPALLNSVDQKVDWIDLGKKNNFDIVIIGETKTNFSLKINRRIGGVQSDVKVPTYRYSSEVNWNVINIANSERLTPVHSTFSKGNLKSSNNTIAANYAKNNVLKLAVPILFQKLMLSWTKKIYSSDYKIIFKNTVAKNDANFAKIINSFRSVNSDSISSRGFNNGKLEYETEVILSLSEFTKELANAFQGYEIIESRKGKIILTKENLNVNKSLTLIIKNCSYRKLTSIKKILSQIIGIKKIDSAKLKDGNATFKLIISSLSEELPILLEDKLKINILTVEDDLIKMEIK